MIYDTVIHSLRWATPHCTRKRYIRIRTSTATSTSTTSNEITVDLFVIYFVHTLQLLVVTYTA